MPAIGATAQSKSFLRQEPIWVCSLTLEGARTLWRCLGHATSTSKVRHLRVQARSAAYKILSDPSASGRAYILKTTGLPKRKKREYCGKANPIKRGVPGIRFGQVIQCSPEL